MGSGSAGAEGAKHRSPNYPSLTFSEALEKTKAIYEKERKNPILLDTAYKHMGYNQRNGASVVALSALKKYGLVVGENGKVRVSDDAHAIIVFPVGHPDRHARIKALAMRPPIFAEVLAGFPDGLPPSDENLSATLQTEFDFSKEAAATFIRALRHAVDLPDVDRPSEKADSAEDTAEEESAMTESAQMKQTTDRLMIPPQLSTGQAKPERHTVKLDDGSWAEILITGTPSKRAKGKLKTYVEVFIIGDDE